LTLRWAFSPKVSVRKGRKAGLLAPLLTPPPTHPTHPSAGNDRLTVHARFVSAQAKMGRVDALNDRDAANAESTRAKTCRQMIKMVLFLVLTIAI